MFFWLLRNYFKLNSFMKIKLNLCAIFSENILLWEIGYKIPYKDLTVWQKKLSDKFTNKLRKIEFK